MDIYCPKCGEPWDMECLHEEASHRGAPSFKNLSDEAKKAVGRKGVNAEYDAYSEAYAKVYESVRGDFQYRGCAALTGYDVTCSEPSERQKDLAAAASAVYDLLGDDMDGAAAMLEDYEMGY